MKTKRVWVASLAALLFSGSLWAQQGQPDERYPMGPGMMGPGMMNPGMMGQGMMNPGMGPGMYGRGMHKGMMGPGMDAHGVMMGQYGLQADDYLKHQEWLDKTATTRRELWMLKFDLMEAQRTHQPREKIAELMREMQNKQQALQESAP
ncbi:hypothetical protein RE428_10840 [Marinobacter nanhaiticus D15-8W]|uniref:Zinc resistance-associated protein n=1 Tax=Marinobacter nanhaiticus D15-8W TaxID=626887 RepID=N6WV89_9GAMM|nr:hypothetical protein [Marinobacter nanhaiticus]ENO12723.1 hypothetical protein J057_15015 [Marinobacter nanhaiticus D15-8W]BES70066.1 hypothetical protein RE428_10840 [Marinobacter nanhaiticus D15-8W]